MRTVLVLLVTLSIGLQAEQTVPREVATTLTAIADIDDPQTALARLAEHTEPPHALIDLVTGQWLLRLADSQTGTVQQETYAKADAAFAAAGERQADLRQARLGRARVAMLQERWRDASGHLGAAIDWLQASRSDIVQATQVAIQAEDWQLAHLLVHEAIVRFPTDDELRQLELAVLLHSGRVAAADRAIAALIDTNADDATLWRQLAWTAQEQDQADKARAAIEIALLQAPDNTDLRRQLATMQLAAGWGTPAHRTMAPLLGDDASATDLTLAARAATLVGKHSEALALIDRIPPADRQRIHHLLSARLHLRDEQPAKALAALQTLIDQGETNADVLTWAGSVAEDAGQSGTAEALYTQASLTSAAAGLRLVALYLRQERQADAQQALAEHLARFPNDREARRLADRLRRR